VEVCESRKENQREEIRMGSDNNFYTVNVLHEQVERKKEILDMEHKWMDNSRSCWIILELNIEESAF
jgi:hypothetical protein